MEKVNKMSENIENDNLEKLRRVFPEFVKDGDINFDALKVFFEKEGKLSENQEKYGLNWAGKSNAFKLIKTPATGTLTPDEKESKDFEKTENIFIEGDNLEVLKLLQKHYREKIKMIYIDPPYNTGKDFIYKDNFTEDKSDYYERTGQNSGGIPMTTNRDSSGRYHSDWLTMIYPRLFLARNLLKEDGVIFISIDDNEVANLRLIMDEIFGEENFIQQIIWKKRGSAPNDQIIGSVHEYILLYAKNIENARLFLKPRSEEQKARYKNPDNHPKGPWASDNLMANIKGGRYVKSLYFPIINSNTGEEHYPSSNGNWRFNERKIQDLLDNNEIYFSENGKGRPKLKRFFCDVKEGVSFASLWDYLSFNNSASQDIEKLLGNLNIYDTPKPTDLIKEILELSTTDSDIILDFFTGSGTTAHAVMDLNAKDDGDRKWICVQLPELTDENSEAKKAGFENIAQIARERIRRAAKKIADENEKKLPTDKESDTEDLDLGFKSYTLSKSNYREWNILNEEDNSVKLKEQMKLIKDRPLVDNFDEKSVVYEIMTKEGFDLNSNVEELTSINNIHFWIVKYGPKTMFVTFAPQLTIGDSDEHSLGEGDLFVCLDSALDDTTKVNISRRKFNVKVV